MEEPSESALSLRTTHCRSPVRETFDSRTAPLLQWGKLASSPLLSRARNTRDSPILRSSPFRRWLVRKDKADSHGLCMIISQGSGGTTRDMSPFDWDPHCG